MSGDALVGTRGGTDVKGGDATRPEWYPFLPGCQSGWGVTPVEMQLCYGWCCKGRDSFKYVVDIVNLGPTLSRNTSKRLRLQNPTLVPLFLCFELRMNLPRFYFNWSESIVS